MLWAVTGCKRSAIKDVARALAMDETTLLRNLRVLERRDLVAIEIGEDRRQRMVSLTTEGRAVFAAALPAWKRAQKEVAKVLVGGRVEEMNGTLVRLARSLQ